MAYEDLGFCARDESGPFIEEKRSCIGGDVAVNIDGIGQYTFVNLFRRD